MGAELITALGLVFVIEGLIWAAFPGAFQKLAALTSDMSEDQLRTVGALAIAFGVFIVWLVRG